MKSDTKAAPTTCRDSATHLNKRGCASPRRLKNNIDDEKGWPGALLTRLTIAIQTFAQRLFPSR